jgi:hypothetical protein
MVGCARENICIRFGVDCSDFSYIKISMSSKVSYFAIAKEKVLRK